MFSQISRIPDLIRKFWGKRCGLYAGVYGNIRFGFYDIQNNQGLGRDYQPQPSSASADNLYLNLDYSGYHKNLIQ